MVVPKLIYCAGGNKRFAKIAIKSGYLYGARLPNDKPHFPIYFADQDWKKPNRRRYMLELKKHRPALATVLDLEKKYQLAEVLSWAEEATQFCDMVVVIPKVRGIIRQIPKKINRKHVVLGFSVPTRFGSTLIPVKEFNDRMVHLLGGSPHRQIEFWHKLSQCSEVISLDGNYVQKMAVRYNQFWVNGDASYAKNRWFPRLDEADGHKWNGNAPYEAFKRSCKNIKQAWAKLIKENGCYIKSKL